MVGCIIQPLLPTAKQVVTALAQNRTTGTGRREIGGEGAWPLWVHRPKLLRARLLLSAFTGGGSGRSNHFKTCKLFLTLKKGGKGEIATFPAPQRTPAAAG